MPTARAARTRLEAMPACRSAMALDMVSPCDRRAPAARYGHKDPGLAPPIPCGVLRRAGTHGRRDGEARAAPAGALVDHDLAAVGLDDGLGDREAEPGAGDGPVGGRGGA